MLNKSTIDQGPLLFSQSIAYTFYKNKLGLDIAFNTFFLNFFVPVLNFISVSQMDLIILFKLLFKGLNL